jgi:hypothetical protein
MGLTKGWERDPQRVCVGGGGRGRSEIERREESKRDWLPVCVCWVSALYMRGFVFVSVSVCNSLCSYLCSYLCLCGGSGGGEREREGERPL